MPIYWGLESIPELKNVPKAERGRVWRRAYNKSFRHWQNWAGLLVVAICVTIGFTIGMEVGCILEAALGGEIWIWRNVVTAIFAGFGGFLYSQISISIARPYLKSELHKRKRR